MSQLDTAVAAGDFLGCTATNLQAFSLNRTYMYTICNAGSSRKKILCVRLLILQHVLHILYIYRFSMYRLSIYYICSILRYSTYRRDVSHDSFAQHPTQHDMDCDVLWLYACCTCKVPRTYDHLDNRAYVCLQQLRAPCLDSAQHDPDSNSPKLLCQRITT